uniref:Uncharacterized protein n=1 Tax=Panagrolaimus sp. JU765 TaxID=591449 RepID=A0AC34Q071_9BILA
MATFNDGAKVIFEVENDDAATIKSIGKHEIVEMPSVEIHNVFCSHNAILLKENVKLVSSKNTMLTGLYVSLFYYGPKPCSGSCLITWDLWTNEIKEQRCSDTSKKGCVVDITKNTLECYCSKYNCNKIGNFSCYTSSTFELGKLGPCPINTKQCRMVKNDTTGEIYSRSCKPEADSDSMEEDTKNDDCDEPGCNNDTIIEKLCPVGVTSKCLGVLDRNFPSFHDPMPQYCVDFEEKCYSVEFDDCKVYTCDFYNLCIYVPNKPLIKAGCTKRRSCHYCVNEGEDRLKPIKHILDYDEGKSYSNSIFLDILLIIGFYFVFM